MSKIVAICTFSEADNYGAVLQCYALEKFLSTSNMQIYITKNNDLNILNDYKLIYHPDSIKALLKMIYNLPEKWKRKNKFNVFRKRYFNMEGLEQSLRWDYLICGSDQIWNPYLSDGIKGVYWGDLQLKKGAILASYAASIGVDDIPKSLYTIVSKHLSKFDYISVREKSAKKLLNKIGVNDVHVNIDPVLLIEAEEWKKIMSRKFRNKGNYILVYSLNQHDQLMRVAKEFADRAGLPIIEISLSDRQLVRKYNVKCVYSIGPEGFLNYIYHANYVFTSSFHCMVFSMTFKKQFYTLAHQNTGSRMKDLLVHYGLEDRLIDDKRLYKSGNEIDYSKFEEKLINDRLLAQQYFSMVLGGNYEKKGYF